MKISQLLDFRWDSFVTSLELGTGKVQPKAVALTQEPTDSADMTPGRTAAGQRASRQSVTTHPVTVCL